MQIYFGGPDMEEKIYIKPPPQQTTSTLNETGKGGVEDDIGEGAYKRLYETWKGGNIFVFGGRLIFGPSVVSLYLTLFLLITPVVLFSLFVPQKLTMEFFHRSSILIAAVAAFFTKFDLFLLLMTSSRDPGIIPRNSHQPETKDVHSEPEENAANFSAIYNLPATKDVTVNGIVVKVKYCHTCMLYRPPRCSHCSVCDNCVERFDHHCPWVGQCIGKRNYRFFFMFVSSTTLLCIYVFIFSLIDLCKTMEVNKSNLWHAILESPIASLLILYTFTGTWFVGGLTIFHLYLIYTNQTTYENFRYRYDKKKNPYNRGFFPNVKEIFFSRIPESKNHFRAKLKLDSTTTNPAKASTATSTPTAPVDLELADGKRQPVSQSEMDDVKSHFHSLNL